MGKRRHRQEADGCAMVTTKKAEVRSMGTAVEINEMRLSTALSSMYHEDRSDLQIMMWHGKQKDFWGGVQWLKDKLWGYGVEPLRGLFPTGNLRTTLKAVAPRGTSVSRAQLAVALVEMGFVVLFVSAERFRTNFPCKRIVEKLANEYN